jgi:hypothetical protein
VAGFVSVRLTKEERRKLLALKQERGCKSISQVVRLMLGFPRGTDEGLEGADDIDSVSKLWEAVIRLIDRHDEDHKLMIKIARQVGVPLERPTLAAVRDDYEPPVRPVVEAQTGPIDLREPRGYRDGDKHPVLPSGFSRG